MAMFQDSKEKDERGLQTVSSFRPGATSGVLQDFADPDIQNEGESTHKGEFGTKRDLVSCWKCSFSIKRESRLIALVGRNLVKCP